MASITDRIFSFIEKITKREWSDNDVYNYVGNFETAYIGYASDEAIRKNAASGGVTTQFLKSLIANGEIDGAIVCKSVVLPGNKVRARLYIAKNDEELLQSQGSKYVLTDYIKEAKPLIENFQGKLAVVALPCEITALKKLMGKDESLQQKVALTISLFCGHASDPQLIDGVVEKLLKNYSAPLRNYTFRYGHWRGRLRAELEDGTVIERKAFEYNQYQNLYYHCTKKCLACYDHFGYNADINIGDTWLFELKKEAIKQNSVIIKTERGKQFFDTVLRRKEVVATENPIRRILDGQSRSVVLHYNVTSRAKMGKRFGINIPDQTKLKTKWHEDLLAYLILRNWKKSKSQKEKKIYRKPKAIIKFELYFFKFLESL